jgi:uncharacterized phage protein gp47/JayE
MAIQFDDLNKMVEDTLTDIVNADVGISDTSKSSVIRVLVQAILTRISTQNVLIKDVYSAMNIDDAYNNELDRLVSIFSITRNGATYCVGMVTFKRNEPAIADISIPQGTIVSTMMDTDNKIIEFITTDYAYMPVGGSSVTVGIIAKVAGAISLGVNMIRKMNSPIMGIDYVINESSIVGGANKETDAELKIRAKAIMDTLGRSTEDGLVNALMALDEVINVLPLDQNRGPGTADLSIVCATIPVTQAVKDTIAQVIKDNKAAGISVMPIYPTIKYIDVTLTLTLTSAVSDSALLKSNVAKAISGYLNGLGVGKTLVVKQLQNKIMDTDKIIFDIPSMTPASNVTCTSEEVIRANLINVMIEGE